MRENAKLFQRDDQVAASATVTQDYMVLPEHGRVFLDVITVGFVTGTTGLASITLLTGGLEIPLVDDYPLTASDQIVTIYPQIHVEKGDGIRMTVRNAGAADMVRSLILGVK